MSDYPTSGMTDCTWFVATARGEDPHQYLVPLCREMAMRQATLRDNTKKCIAVFQYGGDAKDCEPTDDSPIEETALVFNAAQNTVETVHSKVCKAKISPMPLTNGGGYLQRDRAKKIGKAIEAVFDDNDFDQIEEDVVMDALVTDHGAGACIVTDRATHVEIDHVPIEDVLFDEAEIRRRKPRSMFLVPSDGVDVNVLLETYAKDGDEDPYLVGTVEERRAAILKACSKPEAWRAKATEAAKYRVDLFEAWHLKSGCEPEPDGDEDDEGRAVVKHDGRHTVCVDGATLYDEPWNEDHFPILLYVPRKRRRSIWGLSLMRNLIAPQREYEKVTKKIQNQHQKMGVSGFYSQRSANVDVRDIKAGTFGAGFVLEGDSPTPPSPIVIEPVAAGTYQYADSIPRNMMERHGVSPLSAASQIPAGLQQASGKALQVFGDAEDERNLPYHRERERFKVAASWLVVHASARVVARQKSYKVGYRGKYGLEEFDWADFVEDREQLDIRVFPVSQLAKQPAAKFAQLTELLNAQAITVEQFKRLFELPDLESESKLDTADTDVIDRAMDIMVTTGRYMPPDVFDNFDLIIQRAGKFINVCRQQDVPEARLKLLHDYIADTKSLKKQAEDKAKAEAAAAAPPPPMGGAPGGMPPEGPLPGMPPPAPPGPPMPMAA